MSARDVAFTLMALGQVAGCRGKSDTEILAEAVGEIVWLQTALEKGREGHMSQRGQDWTEFAIRVNDHVEGYTVPQYGDKGEDQVTDWTVEDCLKTVQRYIARYGKNQREGQQELDFLKMAHYVQLAAMKFVEATNEP